VRATGSRNRPKAAAHWSNVIALAASRAAAARWARRSATGSLSASDLLTPTPLKIPTPRPAPIRCRVECLHLLACGGDADRRPPLSVRGHTAALEGVNRQACPSTYCTGCDRLFVSTLS
jgi:hypothetical protein